MDKKPLTLDDVRLPITDDPLQQREAVLKAAALDVQAKKLGDTQIRIARELANYILKFQRRRKWPLHVVALALEAMSIQLCVQIYEKGIELDEEPS